MRNGRSFRGGPPPPYFEALASHAMVAASIKTLKPPSSRIVKKLDEILKFPLPPSSARRKALALANRDLTGQLTGIWPSLKIIATWLEKNWKPLIKAP